MSFWEANNERSTTTPPRVGKRAPLISLSKALATSLTKITVAQRDYFVYGKEILAAATGNVVTAIDSVPTTCQAP